MSDIRTCFKGRISRPSDPKSGTQGARIAKTAFRSLIPELVRTPSGYGPGWFGATLSCRSGKRNVCWTIHCRLHYSTKRLVVQVDLHLHLYHPKQCLVGEAGDAYAAVAGGIYRYRIATVNGEAAEEIAWVVQYSKRRLFRAAYLQSHVIQASRRVGDLPHSFVAKPFAVAR